MPRHIHIVEPLPLGHGPAWLGYLLDALLPCVEQITITCPDLAPYRLLTRRSETSHGKLALRLVPWVSDKRSWPDTLHPEHAPEADLTLLTYADVVLKKFRGDLRRQLNSPIWGIWYLPNPREPASFWNPMRLVSGHARGRYRDQAILRRVPVWLSGALVLDERLRERISRRAGLQVEVIPDPAPARPVLDQREARRQLGLPLDRPIFLHFGVANPRKGLGDTLTAWQQLENSSEALLLRAGLTSGKHATRMQTLVNAGRAMLHNRRIPEDAMNTYLQASDWILLPYRNHEGSSGLLAEAAASQRPVIASDYGVVGERVSRHGLGLLFPHLSATGLADSVRAAIDYPVADFAPALSAYAAEHSLDNFTVVLRRSLGLNAMEEERTAAEAAQQPASP